MSVNVTSTRNALVVGITMTGGCGVMKIVRIKESMKGNSMNTLKSKCRKCKYNCEGYCNKLESPIGDESGCVHFDAKGQQDPNVWRMRFSNWLVRYEALKTLTMSGDVNRKLIQKAEHNLLEEIMFKVKKEIDND